MLVTEIVETRSEDGSELHSLLVSEKCIKKIKVSKADEDNILISLDDGSQQISKSFTIVLATEEERGRGQQRTLNPNQSRYSGKMGNCLSLRNVLIFVQIVLFVVSLVMLLKLATYTRAPKSTGGGCLVDPECVRKLQDKGPLVRDLLRWLLQIVRDSSKDQLGIKMSYRSGSKASLDDLSGIDFIVLPNNRTDYRICLLCKGTTKRGWYKNHCNNKFLAKYAAGGCPRLYTSGTGGEEGSWTK